MSLEQIKRIFLDADEAAPRDVGLPSQTAFLGQNTWQRNNPQNKKKQTMVCFECGKTGHKRRNCFLLKKKMRQEKKKSSVDDLVNAVSNVALMAQVNLPPIVNNSTNEG